MILIKINNLRLILNVWLKNNKFYIQKIRHYLQEKHLFFFGIFWYFLKIDYFPDNRD